MFTRFALPSIIFGSDPFCYSRTRGCRRRVDVIIVIRGRSDAVMRFGVRMISWWVFPMIRFKHYAESKGHGV
jgi:hypothetical protein